VNLAYWGSIAGLLHNAGAILGYTLSGFLADAIGRRAYLALMFGGALLMTPVTYLWVHSLSAFLFVVAVNGFFTLAQYSWFAVYLPELFTSTVRSTAIGFVFNASRLVAWLGPLTAGGADPVLRGDSEGGGRLRVRLLARARRDTVHAGNPRPAVAGVKGDLCGRP
jgi:MFS family permease